MTRARVEADRTAAVLAEIDVAMDRFVETVADGAGAAARDLAPVETGELRDGIEVVEVSPGVWQVVSSAAHSLPVEAGTRHMPAQPFLGPSVTSRDPWAGAVSEIRR